MTRLPHILSLFLVFGSMWLHGGVAFAQEEMSGMDMPSMGSSCLQYCLDAVYVDEADDGLVVVDLSVPEFEPIGQMIRTPFVWFPCVDSYHDPSQILTIQKRE